MINFSQMMELKSLFDRLARSHPKVPAFLKAVSKEGIREGTVIEIRVTEPEGREYITNLRVNEEDLACMARLSELQKNMR